MAEENKRLDTLLRLWGVADRRQVRALCAQGRVAVDGVLARTGAEYCRPEACITVDGVPQKPKPPVTVMLNKPDGYVSTAGQRQWPGVLTLLAGDPALCTLKPVGRLDRDTTGLLLLTNDGALNRKIERPEGHVSKTYLVTTDRPLPPGSEEKLAAGITLSDGTVFAPAKLSRVSELVCRVTVTEGKYHEVKRLMRACGALTAALHRQAIGSLQLDPALAPGQYRALTEAEFALIFA